MHVRRVAAFLLIAMAAHVSRFVVRLFDVSSAAAGVATATHVEDDLFRFKVDFVRRRALPLLKTGPVASTADDEAIVRKLIGAVGVHDAELAVARAGCALLDREKAGGSAAAASHAVEIEALKRWCAARIHDPANNAEIFERHDSAIDSVPFGSSEPAIHFLRAVTGLAGVKNHVQPEPSPMACSGC